MADGVNPLAPSTTPDSSMPPYNLPPGGVIGTPVDPPQPPQPPPQPQLDQAGASDVLSGAQGQPQPFQTTPPDQDPEIQAGAAHQSWLAHALLTTVHALGDALGGESKMEVTTDKDGNMKLSKTPMTTGEKWGRIAAGILGGAAKGFSVGQGPGGAAKAVGAGLDMGMQERQAQQQQAEHDISVQQQIMTRNAQNARLNQQVTEGAWNNSHLSRDDRQKQQEFALHHLKEMTDMGIEPIMTGVKDGKTLAQYGIANPNAIDAHMGKDGSMIYNEPDGEGGVNIYQLSSDQTNMPTKTDDVWEQLSLDKDDPTKTVSTMHTTKAGEKVGDRATRRMGLVVQNDNVIKAAYQNKIAGQKQVTAQTPKTLPEFNYAIAKEPDAQKKADLITARDQTFRQELQLRQAGRNVTAPATPETIGNWGTLLSDPRSGVTLANVPAAQRGAVINGMQTAGQKIAHPLTSKELDRSDLATNALSNIEEAQRILQKRPDMFGPLGYGETKFSRAIKGGDPDAMAYLSAINLANLPAVGIHGVRGRYALEDLKKLDSDLYTNADSMTNVLNEIHRSVSEFAPGGGRQLPTPGGGTGGGAASTSATGNTSQAAVAGPATGGANFKAMTPPPNEPAQTGKVYGMGPKGLGWYR
jgi:hypothetical protein